MDLRSALFGVHFDLGQRLAASSSPEDTFSWLSNKVALLKQEKAGVIIPGAHLASIVATDGTDICPGCGAPLKTFSYRENGTDFPAVKCADECGWWQ